MVSTSCADKLAIFHNCMYPYNIIFDRKRNRRTNIQYRDFSPCQLSSHLGFTDNFFAIAEKILSLRKRHNIWKNNHNNNISLIFYFISWAFSAFKIIINFFGKKRNVVVPTFLNKLAFPCVINKKTTKSTKSCG